MALDFDLAEEQEMVRKMIRTFAEKEIAPVAQKLDDKEEFSVPLTNRMGELGLFGLYVSEVYGGSDMGYLSYIIATEEIARVDGSQAATLAAGCSLGISPIYHFGNDSQKEQWLPDLVAGKTLASFGLTEPNAGSDAGATTTTAMLEGVHYQLLNGNQCRLRGASGDREESERIQGTLLYFGPQWDPGV